MDVSKYSERRLNPDSNVDFYFAGIAQLTRASPFQGEGCGFESHYLLKRQIPDGERRSAGMNSTLGPGRVQSLFLLGLLAQMARAPHLHCGGQGFESLTVHKEKRGK